MPGVIRFKIVATFEAHKNLFRSVACSVSGRSGLWPFRFVDVSVCGRVGLWPFRFVAISVVAVMTCYQTGNQFQQIITNNAIHFISIGRRHFYPKFKVQCGIWNYTYTCLRWNQTFVKNRSETLRLTFETKIKDRTWCIWDISSCVTVVL